jgi:UDP-N-acetylmuramate: L-alanyl-gamma-D-glutamyl-meso-diaminopimelate ligase
MHIHILGICGTFMGGLAQLAQAAGHRVTGSDAGIYPPMSHQLEQAGIVITEGYDPAQLVPEPDLVVIGNALSRGNPAVEYILDRNLRYTSGPQFLAEHVLQDRWVLAVSGTHGKTTTASILAHILEQTGLQPGFLIGGVPEDFGVSARFGQAPFFVIEADEYDTAFFDKRSKFVHYRPRTLIMNNLEFDHADIFEDLAAIQKQFHHLVRTVPGNGLIILPVNELALEEVLLKGCWTSCERVSLGEGGEWQANNISDDGSIFEVACHGKNIGQVNWSQTGRHNVSNALTALAAARHAGVPAADAANALCTFAGVKRRMELRGVVAGVQVFDDFAHHPTAIATTLQGARARFTGRLIAVLEPRSNTMRMGHHRQQLAESLVLADAIYMFKPADLEWSLDELAAECTPTAQVYDDIDRLVSALVSDAGEGDHIVIMSNGGFAGIHAKLLQALA